MDFRAACTGVRNLDFRVSEHVRHEFNLSDFATHPPQLGE